MQPNPQILLMQRKSFISQMQPAPVTSTAHFKREQDAKGHIPTSVSSAHLNTRVIISKRHCVTTLHCCYFDTVQGRERGEERQATADWRQHEMTDIARVYCFGLCAGLEVRVAWVLPTVHPSSVPACISPRGETQTSLRTPILHPRISSPPIFCPFHLVSSVTWHLCSLCLCCNDIACDSTCARPGYLCLHTNNSVGGNKCISMT